MTHCLWVSGGVFPLSENPRIDLKNEERWLSVRSMEDGVKTELFAFVPRTDWLLMAHKNFGGDVSIMSSLVDDFLCYASFPKVLAVFVPRWSLTSRQLLEPSSVFPPSTSFATSPKNPKPSAVHCLLTQMANIQSLHQPYSLIPTICTQQCSSNLQHSSR